MKIPIEDISPAGLEIQFDESKNILGEALSGVSLPPDVVIDPKIMGHVTITKNMEEILISVVVEVNLTMKCLDASANSSLQFPSTSTSRLDGRLDKMANMRRTLSWISTKSLFMMKKSTLVS